MKLSKLIDEMFGMKPQLSDEDNVTAATADQETYLGDVPYDTVTSDQVDTGLVPVQMLQDVPLITVERAARGFATHAEYVINGPVRVVQRNLRRRAVQLYAPSTNTKIIAIGPSEVVSINNSYALNPGTSTVFIPTSSDIWAVAEDATPQRLNVIELTEDG